MNFEGSVLVVGLLMRIERFMSAGARLIKFQVGNIQNLRQYEILKA